MDFELRATPTAESPDEPARSTAGGGFEISTAPLIASEPTPELADVPPATTTPLLCLMARDPHTLFAYWDVNWPAAFRDGEPADRKVHLRVLDADGSEQRVEVEPMAGSCYVNVESADAAYSAEIGFYHPGQTWNSIASSNLISTPPDQFADADQSEFATVPFHLSFQRMIDMLRMSRSDETPLIAKLAAFRDNAGTAEIRTLRPEERELADALEQADASRPPPAAPSRAARDLWSRHRLERILGFGATSPSGGFGGSSSGS